eukprot:121890-Pelagomonas_calceolata.AAC.1
MKTDPYKVANILEKFYNESMAAPSIKTGAYLPTDPQAKCNFSWMEQQYEHHVLLETPITRAENTIQ